MSYDVTNTKNTDATVSTAKGANVRSLAVAALLTFGAGLLVMAGYIMLSGFFGGFLGVIGAVFAIIWWRSVQGKVIPANTSNKALIVLGAAVAALFVLVLLLS